MSSYNYKENIFFNFRIFISLAVEIAILVISCLFAVVTAIVLIAGWRITCDNLQGQTNSTSL